MQYGIGASDSLTSPARYILRTILPKDQLLPQFMISAQTNAVIGPFDAPMHGPIAP